MAADDLRAGRGVRRVRWVERVLVLAGLAALSWAAALAAEAMIAQRRARSSLEAIMPAETAVAHAAPEGEGVAPAAVLDAGAAIAVLSIPRIELSAAVLHGSDAQTLRRGPGHLENTAYPGEPGNVVIAGHRDSFFRPLRHIRMGDDIYLQTPQGQFHYQVSSLRVVPPQDVSVLAPTDAATLTLITCYPFWVFGNAPDRFVVRATRAAPADNDDESLVRQAVGRYMSMQGVRPTPACAVAFADGRATADCDRRTFTLERSHGGWAIGSIVLK